MNSEFDNNIVVNPKQSNCNVVVNRPNLKRLKGRKRHVSDTLTQKRNHWRKYRHKKRSWKPYYKLTAEERKQLEIYEEKRAERTRALRFKNGFPVAPYNTTQFLLNDRLQNEHGEPCINVDEIVEHIRCSRRTRSRSESYDLAANPVNFSSSGIRPRAQTSSTQSEDACVAPPLQWGQSSTESGIDCVEVGTADAAAFRYRSLTNVTTSGDDGDDGSYDSTSTSDEMEEQRQFDEAYELAHSERLESMSKNDLIKDFLELEKQVDRIQRELSVRTREFDQLRQQLTIKEGISIVS